MGCGPSKKRVELQHNIHMLRNFNETLRNWEDDHEKDIQDAIVNKEAADALVKSASTPEEKVWAEKEAASAAHVLALWKKPLVDICHIYPKIMQKRLELEKRVLELVLKNTWTGSAPWSLNKEVSQKNKKKKKPRKGFF